MPDLRYPIGPEEEFPTTTAQQRATWIADLTAAPAAMRAAVAGLTELQLATPYREGGWTVRQVVHHLADSHMHGYIRTKFALTLPEPVIMPYDETKWAVLPDVESVDIEGSLTILDGLHARWAALFQSLSESELQRAYRHPERGIVRLDQQLASYAWHSRHHVAHITALTSRSGWRR